MKPSALYQERLQTFNLQHDPVQAKMMEQFDTLQHALASTSNKPKSSFISRLLKPSDTTPAWHFVPGYYMWGGVGRGKTMLMDIFYDSLDTPHKQRVHFHRFMQSIHKSLRQHENTKNPLHIIAGEISQNCRVLCLDEFHVNDIGDAMLLGGLLEVLFAQGITLLTTSNRPPDDLYKDGLQRERFVPAIERLKSNTHVVNIDNEVDYRLLTLQTNHTYHQPLNAQTAEKLQHIFTTLTTGEPCDNTHIEIEGHQIPILGEAEGAIWFDFSVLCEGNRSQNDYIEIAQEHHSVFVSNIPVMNDELKDAARRFLNLLDVFYDHKVKLIVTAAAEAHHLYKGEFLAFEFDRAVSRMIEMQSEEYLAQNHMAE